MKKENKKTAYCTPKLESLTFEAERGFAISGHSAHQDELSEVEFSM